MRTTLKDRLLGRVEKTAGRLMDDDIPADDTTFEDAATLSEKSEAPAQIDLRDDSNASAAEQRHEAARRRREEANARNALAEQAAAAVPRTPAE